MRLNISVAKQKQKKKKTMQCFLFVNFLYIYVLRVFSFIHLLCNHCFILVRATVGVGIYSVKGMNQLHQGKHSYKQIDLGGLYYL